jgi:hypothetical protein
LTVRIKSNTGCNHVMGDPCARCDAQMSGPICTPAIQSFPEAIYDNMYHPWETPKPISSREELRQECERRGVYSHSLRDSMHFKSGPTRWI